MGRASGLWVECNQTKHWGYDSSTFMCEGAFNVCNSTTKAKQKRSTENAEPHVICTNKPGNVRMEDGVLLRGMSQATKGTHALGPYQYIERPFGQYNEAEGMPTVTLR